MIDSISESVIFLICMLKILVYSATQSSVKLTKQKITTIWFVQLMLPLLNVFAVFLGSSESVQSQVLRWFMLHMLRNWKFDVAIYVAVGVYMMFALVVIKCYFITPCYMRRTRQMTKWWFQYLDILLRWATCVLEIGDSI